MDATNVNGADKLIIRCLPLYFCLIAVACISKSKCSEYVISSVPANISMLSINIADKNCHTNVINSAIREATEKINPTSIAHGFMISNSIVHMACGPGEVNPISLINLAIAIDITTYLFLMNFYSAVQMRCKKQCLENYSKHHLN